MFKVCCYCLAWSCLKSHPGSSRSGSSSRGQGSAGGPTGPGRQGAPGSQTDGAAGQRTQLQQQAQTSAARPGQQSAPTTTGTQQQPPAQGQGMGIGQGQAKPGQMGSAGGPMGQARQTGPTGSAPVTMVSRAWGNNIIRLTWAAEKHAIVMVIILIQHFSGPIIHYHTLMVVNLHLWPQLPWDRTVTSPTTTHIHTGHCG